MGAEQRRLLQEVGFGARTNKANVLGEDEVFPSTGRRCPIAGWEGMMRWGWGRSEPAAWAGCEEQRVASQPFPRASFHCVLSSGPLPLQSQTVHGRTPHTAGPGKRCSRSLHSCRVSPVPVILYGCSSTQTELFIFEAAGRCCERGG